MPGIMQSSRIRSGRTLLFEIHFKASAPEVAQCSCTTQLRCQLVPLYTHMHTHTHTHTHISQLVSLCTHPHTPTHTHTPQLVSLCTHPYTPTHTETHQVVLFRVHIFRV